MATLRPNSYLCDVVSILFYKIDQKIKYLLLNSNELLTLPCSTILNENWNETADFVQDRTIGKRFEKSILKIIKVWVPSLPRKHVYHIIFSVQLPENVDAKTNDSLKV